MTGVCQKPRIKCGDCANRLLIPLTDEVIYAHLSGKHVVGVYPLLADDSCHFLAVDFDEADWRQDALAFKRSCLELGVPVALEISRSGNGAHAWIFFKGKVYARDARRLGTAVISFTCMKMRQLELTSYDRLFPNQGCEHTNLGASNRVAQTVAGAAANVPGSGKRRDWRYRRRQVKADGPHRYRRDAVRLAAGRGQCVG